MCEPKSPDSELMARKELEKIELEIEELKDNRSAFGKIAKVTLPFLAGLIGLVISIASFIISNNTSDRQMALELRLKDREAFRLALDLAFGDKVNQSGHVAGIWALSEFWRKPEYEQQLAALLAATLTSGGQDEHMSRAAAAEVIGTAIQPEDMRSQKDKERTRRVKELLYGSHLTWSVGTVTFQNFFLRKACEGKDKDCFADQLEQTRQAIRKNWEFLEDANLSQTDLSGIQLYAADLEGASLDDALVSHASFICADLENTHWDKVERIESLEKQAPHVDRANVHGVQPDSVRIWATNHHAVDLAHKDWVKYRKAFPECKDWEQLEKK